MKRVEINEKVGISADFVTILEQCMGYRAECEKNARAFYLKRKCICDKTQVRFTSNARAFDSKCKGVFGEFRKGKYDGLSGLAGIFIKCIYAGCGKIQRLYFSTPVYREFAKPVPTPTTRQDFFPHPSPEASGKRPCVSTKTYLRLIQNVLVF